MSCVKVSFLARPHNVEFKCVGKLIFDINYVEHAASLQDIGITWFNSKGQYHRENGPAGIWEYGEQYWFRYGKYHREDGPAIICSPGRQSWYLNGIYYFEKNFNKEMGRRNELRKRKIITETLYC